MRALFAVLSLLTVMFAGCNDAPAPRDDCLGTSTHDALAIGHLDDDKYQDLALGGDGVLLCMGEPGGTFAEAVGLDAPCPSCAVESLALADLDEDRDQDLVVAGDAGVNVFARTASGFVEAAHPALGGLMLESVSVVDTDNDGLLDIVGIMDGVLVQARNDNGTFQAPVPIAPASMYAFFFFDDDTLLDVAVADAGGMAVWSNQRDANGTFAPAARRWDGPTPTSIVPVDIDNDQAMDLLVATPGGVHMVRNDVGLALESLEGPWEGVPVTRAVPVDLRNDGYQDIAAWHDGRLRVYDNDGRDFSKGPASGFDARNVLGVIDADQDGALEVLGIGDGGDTYRPKGKVGHHFAMRMHGNQSASAGFGVKTSLSSGTSILFRVAGGVGAPGIAMAPEIHFGLGGEEDLAPEYTLAILWPSGILQFQRMDLDFFLDKRLEARESASEAPWTAC